VLQPYAGVARAKFLALPVTLVAVGAAASAYDGAFDGLRSALALMGLVAAHVAVNVLNELSDHRTGIDGETRRTPFSGGSGTLQAGNLSTGQARVLAAMAGAVAAAIGGWFLVHVGWPLVPYLVLGCLAVLFYTDLLARTYLGEFFAGLGLGCLPVAATALVQDGSLGPAAVAASLPAFFMTFNLLLLNEFPDEDADRKGGRRSLVLLLGRTGAAGLYVAVALAVPIAIVAGVARGALHPLCLAACLPTLLLAPAFSWALRSPADPTPLPALGSNVGWNLATNLLLAITLVVASRLPA
jgi:1,4-dihydroxy-2-naphthoate octaprenyltransferase